MNDDVLMVVEGMQQEPEQGRHMSRDNRTHVRFRGSLTCFAMDTELVPENT